MHFPFMYHFKGRSDIDEARLILFFWGTDRQKGIRNPHMENMSTHTNF